MPRTHRDPEIRTSGNFAPEDFREICRTHRNLGTLWSLGTARYLRGNFGHRCRSERPTTKPSEGWSGCWIEVVGGFLKKKYKHIFIIRTYYFTFILIIPYFNFHSFAACSELRRMHMTLAGPSTSFLRCLQSKSVIRMSRCSSRIYDCTSVPNEQVQ